MRLKVKAHPERVPFKVCNISMDDYQKIINDCDERKASIAVEKVLLSQLIATQREVDFNPNPAYLKPSYMQYHPFTYLKDRPVVLEFKHHFFILDGHHRLAKAVKDHLKEFECYVFKRSDDWHLASSLEGAL